MEFFENTYFNIVDIIIISIILISCVVATFRGFIKEAFSIVSWIFALIVAIKLYEKFKLELIEYISHTPPPRSCVGLWIADTTYHG